MILFILALSLIHLCSADNTTPTSLNTTIPPGREKLFEAGHNLTVFYKTPGCGYGPGHELVRTAMIYLEELEALEEDVRDHKLHAMDAVWEIYLNGGPLHIKQIPYGEFIKTFNWDGEDISEYFTLVDDTRRTWNKLVEILEDEADSDIIV